MPEPGQCAEHGRQIAVLENEQKHTVVRLDNMSARLKQVERQVDRFLGGYAVVIFLLAFVATIAGNVVSAKLSSPPPAHAQAQR